MCSTQTCRQRNRVNVKEVPPPLRAHPRVKGAAGKKPQGGPHSLSLLSFLATQTLSFQRALFDVSSRPRSLPSFQITKRPDFFSHYFENFCFLVFVFEK